MNNKLLAGFGRADVTPCMGINLAGYYQIRLADGVLDPLQVDALALAVDEKKVLLISLDHCGLLIKDTTYLKSVITEKTGVPSDSIVISSTHTHTGPDTAVDHKGEIEQDYFKFLTAKMVDACMFALNDLKPAVMGWKVGNAPNIAFVRRFRMKDGYVRTNPGVGNPDIAHPLGDVDERVNVLRFNREGGDTIVLMNFGNHPDVVGGNKVSADWPGLARTKLETFIPGVKAMFFNGAEGDVNHVNVNAKDGDLNDLANDFDDVLRGYGHANHMANVLAGAVLQVYDKVNYIDVDRLASVEKVIDVAANKGTPEEMPLAHKYFDLHTAGKDDEIPFKGMELTTVVAEAQRMVELENHSDFFHMPIMAIAIGNVGIATMPGESFTWMGRELKKEEGWDLVLPFANANGSECYFPTEDAYIEGGYEARSCPLKQGNAEFITEECAKLLRELRK